MKTFYPLAIFWLFVIFPTQAYVARGKTDTSNGYCEGDYGKVPVGGTGYDDVHCEEIVCSEGEYQRLGCGVAMVADPNCRLVSRPGHYPNCCKQFVECDKNGSSEENSEEQDSAENYSTYSEEQQSTYSEEQQSSYSEEQESTYSEEQQSSTSEEQQSSNSDEQQSTNSKKKPCKCSQS